MSMSKKDYELIASVVSTTRQELISALYLNGDTAASMEALDLLVKNLSVALKKDNSSFQTNTFINSCERPRARRRVSSR